MANPQPPTLHGHPRATPSRCFVRLRDRLELFLERFVDGDPTAQAGFESYKADRDRKWAERDTMKKEEAKKKKKKKKKVSIATVAISITNGPADETPVWNATSPGTDDVPTQNHDNGETGLNVPKTRKKDKGKSKENTPCPEDDDDMGRFPGAAGGSRARRHVDVPPRQRGTQRSTTFSSLVGSTLGEQRRRKRKRSDARPGYFDPDPFPQGPSCDTNTTFAEAGVGDEDRLEMNVPVDLGRRSWTFPIGTAR
ncbi:hypothetical protein LY78DRAFT_490552 [Colletotrichum sublineola]|uniref:Uncharacterized protein n=1 Tax=Colletotrichum sublineola TaxID=1173701 RepID=A0A066XCJ2_COLSU|nr:hypothetical protein LY78DRAFT_490552 [Colletotrichum sublineola]KDN63700.1 hypothetical protein CSUB01_04741 [Colletotrichum sublineola]